MQRFVRWIPMRAAGIVVATLLMFASTGTAQDPPARVIPGVSLEGLSAQQVDTVWRIANEVVCDCGCSFGKLIDCRTKDTTCPRSPVMLKQAVSMAKIGKDFDTIVAAIKKRPAKPPAPKKPSEPLILSVGASPTKGPDSAPVRIFEISDFQ